MPVPSQPPLPIPGFTRVSTQVFSPNEQISFPSSGEIKVFDGDMWINQTIAEAGISLASQALIAGGTTGQVLTKISGVDFDIEWADSAGGGGGTTLSALTDTLISSVGSGELLKYNGSAWVNQTLAEAGVAAASHTHTLANITDAGTAAAAATGDFAAASHTHTMGDLNDVTVTSIGSGDLLQWDGAAWINRTIAQLDLADRSIDNDWQIQQTFDSPRIEGVVGMFSTGYTTIESDATTGEVVTFPNATGEIPIITDATPANGEFLVRSGGVGYLSRGLQWGDIKDEYSGSVFPITPSDGQAFYRSDLDMPELFHWDAGRSKWLGELRTIVVGRSSSSTTNLDLTSNGVIFSVSRGFLTPFQMCIVGVEMFSVNNWTGDIKAFEGSTDLGSILTVSASRAAHDHTVNFVLDADIGWPHKYFKAVADGKTTVSNPIVTIFMRRVAT